jgi:signal transduction histidine kinase
VDAGRFRIAYRDGVTSSRRPERDRPGPARRRHQPAGLAVLITLVQVVGTTLAARGQPADLDPLGYALLVAGGLVLLFRRRYPVLTVAVVTATSVLYHGLDYPRGPTFLALVIAAVVAIRDGHRYLVWPITAAGYAGWVALAGPPLDRALVVAAWGAGVGLLGELAGAGARMRQEQFRLRQEQRRRQASEERLRIAQELHDVLGHHLSLINVQAGVGLHLMDRQPDQARAALATIKQASAEALQEVRSVLAALYPAGEAAPRTPVPRLERLDELTGNAGLPVRTTIRGEPRTLPAELDRAAYRIVQEALTNVRRHAGAGVTATVLIEYRPEELVVQVEDDGGEGGAVAGRGADPPVEGSGIGGMRERATSLGGSLTARPGPEGGFRIAARLPLPARTPEGAR